MKVVRMKGAEWITWMVGKLKDGGGKVNIIMEDFEESDKFSLVTARRERGDFGLYHCNNYNFTRCLCLLLPLQTTRLSSYAAMRMRRGPMLSLNSSFIVDLTLLHSLTLHLQSTS